MQRVTPHIQTCLVMTTPNAGQSNTASEFRVSRALNATTIEGSAQRGLPRVGALLRGFSQDGQILAGIQVGNNTVFATKTVPCILSQPCGSTLPASHMHLLFRTPSFRGQACVPHNVLPAFFFVLTQSTKRQKPAQNVGFKGMILNNSGQLRQLPSNITTQQKGQTSCEFHVSSLLRRPARVLPPAATQPANKLSWAAAPVRLGPQCSVPIRCSVPPLGLRATCFTAKRRTPVANTRSSGRAPSRPSSRIRPTWGCFPAAAFCVSRTPSQRTFHVQ